MINQSNGRWKHIAYSNSLSLMYVLWLNIFSMDWYFTETIKQTKDYFTGLRLMEKHDNKKYKWHFSENKKLSNRSVWYGKNANCRNKNADIQPTAYNTFRNSVHQVRSKSRIRKPNNFTIAGGTPPKEPNRTVKIEQGYII